MTNRTCLFFLGKPTKDSFAFFTIFRPNKNYPDGQIKDFIKSILSHSRTLQVPIGVDPLGHLFGILSINACFALSQILFQSHQQKFSATTMRLEFRTPFVFNIGQGIGRVKCKTNWNYFFPNCLKITQNHSTYLKITKKSHSTLRAKRATFTFWVDKSWLKIPKNGPFWWVFEILKKLGQTVLPDGSF